MALRFMANRLKRFFIYRVLHVDDTPHRIALGVAIGIFVTWTPTIGFQMVLCLALAALFGANKLVGLPFVWISNPLTLWAIYGPNYLLGRWLLGGNRPAPDFIRAAAWTGGWVERIRVWWTETWHVFGPLWLGSIIMGLLLGSITYVLVYRAVVFYRRHRPLLFLRAVRARRRRDRAASRRPDQT